MKKRILAILLATIPFASAHGPEFLHAMEDHPFKFLIALGISMILTALVVGVMYKLSR